jgi:hypothetical protein
MRLRPSRLSRWSKSAHKARLDEEYEGCDHEAVSNPELAAVPTTEITLRTVGIAMTSERPSHVRF